MGYPVTNENKSSANSPSFDLMALRFKSAKKIEIVTFDITINDSPIKIKEEINNAAGLIKFLIYDH
jgi:hypothetical protein